MFQIWHNQRQSQHWLKIPGQTIESSVNFSSIRKTYSLAVRYTYAVNGNQYIGDRFDFYQHGYTSERVAMAQLWPYSVGSKVTVYYDPEKPQNAVLNRHVPISLYFIYLLLISAPMTVAIVGLQDLLTIPAIK